MRLRAKSILSGVALMNGLTLIGKVAAQYLNNAIDAREPDEGTARFLLDRLTGEQIAVICRTILDTPHLVRDVEIKIPEALGAEFDLPSEVLTLEGPVHWRHAACSKAALLLASVNDNEEQSLAVLTRIGARDIKTAHGLWIEIAGRGLQLPSQQLNWWEKALKGLLGASEFSLDQFAEYVALTTQCISESGLSVRDALGWALPVLGLPRDTSYFQAITEKKLGQAKSWEKMFKNASVQRACLLLKQTPTRKLIENEELKNQFNNVKQDIPDSHHQTIENFIASPPGWDVSSQALAELEWERDNINSLFSGLRVKKTDLPSATTEFFEEEHPDELTQEEQDYLNNLRKRKNIKEPIDDDREFYESHRKELEENRSLKGKWDKFVYGQPIECTDFLAGMLSAVERLFERADRPIGKKKLTVRTQKGPGQSKWLELNADVGLYFCTRYRGIAKLTTPEVRWDTHWLFKYDELLEKAAKKAKKYKRNESTARVATEIKFVVELSYRSATDEDTQTVQLVWRGNPNAIGIELPSDLNRLAKSPFLISEVRRELVNKKGKLQGVSLNDVATLTAVFGRDCGSLIGTQKSSDDLARILPQALKNAVQEQSLSTVEAQSIESVWSSFVGSYTEAIQSLTSTMGISDDSLLMQVEFYHELMRAVLTCARGDKNRSNILAPILRVGCVKVTGGKSAAIIAPWHPLRLAAITVKARQVSGLLRHILNSEQTDFGDSKLFFSDLRNELEHPYYPEICVEYAGDEPKLLCATDTVNDYSLMERPIREQFDQPTHENPSDAAGKLLDLTKRYLELLPHEKTNLTIVLYNCDSARLPQFVVTKLSEMEEERDEVRCQVTLRHQNTEKLNRLYREMMEGFDADPDAYVASEMSQDYLAKLRIGVMADEAPMRDEKEGRVADIVFLQDVISRQAQEKWESALTDNSYPTLLEHVPPRWSRKRALRKDELKSTAYLVCPRQPQVGESYVQAVACLVNSEDAQTGQVTLPVRQILFSSQETSKIFEEVHRLGEWVVNYDDLIERRQLMNKGVNVIRYQQSQTDGRNLLVSSKSPLNLLEVLVRRRLNDLSLGLSDPDLGALTKRFIAEANAVSGDIVLRAAKRGHFASELVGVVLSKILVVAEMGSDSPIGWYFLDDYASWLGQKEEQIADIMAICPRVSNGRRFLKIVITESKYITEDGLADSRKKSQKQLWETVARIESAVFGNPGRLDRDLWLSRISDIMLEGIEQGINSPIQIEEWRNDLRLGRLPIDLSGYSHVFISGPSGSTKSSEQVNIPKVERCYQEVFSREQVRELVLAFHRNQPVSSVREKLGDEKPWLQSDPKPPAERVSWHSTATQTVASRKDVTSGVHALEHGKTSASNSAVGDGAIEGNVFAPDTIVKTASEDSVGSPTVDQTAMETSESHSDVSTGFDLAVRGDEPSTEPASTSVDSWIRRRIFKTEEDVSAQAWLKEAVQRLRNALISYELQAQVLGQRLTPNAALIRLRGTDRLTVDGIERKQTQLLTTHALKVINVSALPGEVLVSIARPQRQAISLDEVWARRKLNLVSGVNLSLVVGVKEVDGEILYLNLAREFEGLQQHAPHTLIAGATGSGKSVLLRNLLLDVCSFNSPEEAKIYLIDPKSGVDYFALEDLPHLAEGIIDDRFKAIEVLEGLVANMDRRYSRFRQVKVSDLMTYNAKVDTGERMPVLLAVHDEFAEWMLVEEYRDAVSAIVQRLGAKARAAGIHLIFAAQRPDATVFPMQLRDNLGNRLILKVESVGTSEISLGQKGAELLLGKGHLIARLTGEAGLIYAQVPFVSNEEAAELVSAIRMNYVD
jgi:S-DNA-T family DNA segregation ATPase FtsK/SpoIIIE